jgi:kinesin family protein 6/9
MGASKDPAGGSNVEIYLRLKPTPKASPLVTLDTVRPVVILPARGRHRRDSSARETREPRGEAERRRRGHAKPRSSLQRRSRSFTTPPGRVAPPTLDPADPVPTSPLARSFIRTFRFPRFFFPLQQKTSKKKPQTEQTVRFEIPRDANAGYVNNQRETFGFKFDGVLTPDAGQDEVFDRVASKIVTGALDGFNGTVFAYGQTGSGKTFTITGGAERYVDRGIVPRAVSKVFSEMSKRNDGATYEVSVSYVEVYNDQAYDLLCDGAEALGGKNATKEVLNGKEKEKSRSTPSETDAFLPKVALLEDDDGVIHARGCSSHRAGSEEDALNLLFLGDVNRAVAETPMNLQSSRSHCVFTMSVERRVAGSETVRRGKIHLVDLAGSERVGKTGVSGSALREAKHINLSLHALEKVVVALSDGDPHVPYRDSVMTMLLKDSLGGNCATAMVATVNPEFEHVFEGISTCRFALRIASVRNALLVNEETDPKLVIKRLREENRALRAELKLARGDVDGRDALSESEIARLRSDIERFCDDENDEPDLGGSMLKIRAALRVFRDLARTSRVGPNAGAATAVLAEGETNAAKENASEIERLASLVRRRDEEIKVLVAMLEKQSGLSSVANGAARSVARAEKEGGKQTEKHARSAFGPGPAKPSTPPSSMESSPLLSARLGKKKQNHFFTDRNAAFEHFKRGHASRDAIEANKKTLREQYAEAKRLGEAVNASRNAIASTRTEIENVRVKNVFFLRRDTRSVEKYDSRRVEGRLGRGACAFGEGGGREARV